MKYNFYSLKGMNDILPFESDKWNILNEIINKWLNIYGYKNIITPIMEKTKLFNKGIGETTDIIEKEMYTFINKEKESLSLRPEITSGIIRSVIENNMLYQKTQKLYSIGPVFRQEKPQKGRYRQFNQVNVEALGFKGPDIDAEIIVMISRLWKILGIKNIKLQINSIGQLKERYIYKYALIKYLKKNFDLLNSYEKVNVIYNPLRILDSKNKFVKSIIYDAPNLLDFLSEKSFLHLEKICNILNYSGVKYNLNTKLVRGIDYYNLTVFEWIMNDVKFNKTICGGGRYDNLSELLGGKKCHAIGFGIGLERLIYIWKRKNQLNRFNCDIYMIYEGKLAKQIAYILSEKLRNYGISVIVNFNESSFKKQFKNANKSGALNAIILGNYEISNKIINIKPLRVNSKNYFQYKIPIIRLIKMLEN